MSGGKWFRITAVFLALAAVLVVTACAGSAFPDSGDRVKVTATTGMIADAVKEVGGERVHVVGLMRAGVDPHYYKATQGDLRKLEQADIVFYNGLYLEGKMGDVLAQMAEKKPTVAVGESVDRSKLRAGDPEQGTEFDPHIWFDVEMWIDVVERIRAQLSQIDPAHAAVYESNALNYTDRLEQLHDYARTQLALIPQSSRVLVTAHDAFGYFGAAYDVEVVGLQGMSTASEAGLKDIADLRDFLIARNIKAVFVESSVPKKTINAVISGAKSKGHEVVIGGELFSDAMGKEGTLEGTYLGMIRHNIDTIVGALK